MFFFKSLKNMKISSIYSILILCFNQEILSQKHPFDCKDKPDLIVRAAFYYNRMYYIIINAKEYVTVFKRESGHKEISGLHPWRLGKVAAAFDDGQSLIVINEKINNLEHNWTIFNIENGHSMTSIGPYNQNYKIKENQIIKAFTMVRENAWFFLLDSKY